MDKKLTQEDEVRLLRGALQDMGVRVRKLEREKEALAKSVAHNTERLDKIVAWILPTNDTIHRLAKKIGMY